jgi:hypothetical protein
LESCDLSVAKIVFVLPHNASVSGGQLAGRPTAPTG